MRNSAKLKVKKASCESKKPDIRLLPSKPQKMEDYIQQLFTAIEVTGCQWATD